MNGARPSNVESMTLVMTQAVGTKIGLLLSVSDWQKAQALFNKIKLRDPAFARLQFRASPLEGGNAIIVRGGAYPAVPSPEALDL